jgi:hypothetical protein
MSDLLTPDELGDKLKAGEITKEQAIEIMSERARREALGGLYGPPPEPGQGDPNALARANRVIRMITITTAVLGLILILILVWVYMSK